MGKNEPLEKSRYISVYKKPHGFRSWITYIHSGTTIISIMSDNENTAALKYNILANFFHGESAVHNDIKVSPSVYNKTAREVYYQLTTPTSIQKTYSIQGCKKIKNASTEYVGVYEFKNANLTNPFNAYICKEKKRYSLGYYRTAQIAAASYNIAAKALYGDNARLNKVDMDFVDDKYIKHVMGKLGRI